MAAIEGTEAEVTELLTDGVVIAAVNSATSVVASGHDEAVRKLLDAARQQGRRATPLHVSHAFHSPLMEPMLAEFAGIAAQVTYHRPTLHAVSTLTGAVLDGDDWTTPDYWVRQVREAVRFHTAARTAVDELGVARFLELGPDPVLSALLDTAPAACAAPRPRRTGDGAHGPGRAVRTRDAARLGGRLRRHGRTRGAPADVRLPAPALLARSTAHHRRRRGPRPAPRPTPSWAPPCPSPTPTRCC